MMFDPDKICPLIGDKCLGKSCQWFITLSGHDPNDPDNTKYTNEPGCAVAWLPILQIEGAQKTNQVSVEVSQLRSEVSGGGNGKVSVPVDELIRFQEEYKSLQKEVETLKQKMLSDSTSE